MSRIRANTIALGLSFFVTAVLAFLQIKILTNHLPEDRFGAWIAVVGVGALLGTLTELGLPQVIIRYGAKFDAEHRLGRLRKLLGFAFRVHLGAVAVMVVVLAISGPSLASVLGEGQLDRRLILLGYLAMASGTLRALNNGSFRSLRRMSYVAYLEIAFSVLVTLGYFILRRNLTVEQVLATFIGCSVLIAATGLVVLLRLLRRIPSEESGAAVETPVRSVAREVRDYWQGAAAAGVFLVAIEFFDKPLLAGLVSLPVLALFGVASRLALFPRRLLYVPMQVINPEITHKWESGRRDELQSDLGLFIKLELGLGLALIAPLALFAKPLILLVSTPQYLGAAPVLWVLTAVIPLLCLHQPLVLFLRAIGHVWLAFIADAGWLVVYLGLGSLLVGPWGLTGFVAGQVVASVLVLSYALWVFGRRSLPRPRFRFFLGRAALSAAIWAVCVAGGRALPAETALWQVGMMAVGLALMGNLLLVWGGFLTRDDEIRTIAMLAGRGFVGRVAAALFAWPRRVRPRFLAMSLLLGSIPMWAGCSSSDLEPGCSSGDAVPAQVREELETRAAALYAMIENLDYDSIYEQAPDRMQKLDKVQFGLRIVGPAARYGLPKTPVTTSIHVINVVPGHPMDNPRKCGDPESPEYVELLLLDEPPLQASLVQAEQRDGIVYRYSTLWFYEGERWRCGDFRVRPNLVLGHNASHFAEMGARLRDAGRSRAGFLYLRVAEDLLMPNPWTHPKGWRELVEEMKRIRVNRMPVAFTDVWEVAGKQLKVSNLAYDIQDGELGLHLRIQPETPADSVAYHQRAVDLLQYVRAEFPEYPESFQFLQVRAVIPENDAVGWQWRFPLRVPEGND